MESQTLQDMLNWIIEHPELARTIYDLLRPLVASGIRNLKSVYQDLIRTDPPTSNSSRLEVSDQKDQSSESE